MTSSLAPPPDDLRITLKPPMWRRPPHPSILLTIAIGAVAFTAAAQHPIGIVTTFGFATTVIASRTGGWLDSRRSRWLVLAALGPAMMLSIRSSVWLVPLNLLAAAGLIMLAAAVRPDDRSIITALRRLAWGPTLVAPAVWSIDLVSRSAASIPRRAGFGRRLFEIGRGVAIAAPMVIILVALLATADALFQSAVMVNVDAVLIARNIFLLGCGVIAMSALTGHGTWMHSSRVSTLRLRLGGLELGIVLASIAAVYSAFVTSQVVALAAGAAYVERSTGLTYAEYARRGFFQLLAAAALTVAIVWFLDRRRSALGGPAQRRLLTLELVIVGLTITVVVVAIRRLFLYEAEFGLTMLRFSTIVFAAWIGVVLVLFALHLGGRLPIDLTASVLGAAFVTLLAVNVANPEALVAQRNIDRFGTTGALDIAYLVNNLGPDAYPVILSDTEAGARLCSTVSEPDDRLAVFNLGRVRAADAYDHACAIG